MTELDFIDWLRRQTGSSRRVIVGPGDDAAVLPKTAGPVLATTDMLLDGSSFRLVEAGPRRVGRKSMAVNLSDIAAMAGRPTSALVSVGMPGQHNCGNLARELYTGMREIADEFDTSIIGGDTTSWNGDLVISITMLGEVTGNGPVLRNGAQPGDWLMVTGPLGGSILGKHLDFVPRVREAQQLHKLTELHAMMDISDGLALDVWRMCRESKCGAVFFADKIPVAEAAHRMKDDVSPLDHALADGEDFELAFAVAPDEGRQLLKTQPIDIITLYHCGEFVRDGLWLEEKGSRQPLEAKGFIHSFE